MRIPRWIRRDTDRQLRAIIVTQQVALYNKERECREWQRIAERHAADSLEHLADTINNLRRTRDDLEAIISNLRAKLHHLQMVDSGE